MAATEDQVSWNLSQKISDQIDALLKGGRRNTILGLHLGCFYMFKEIRLLINHHFKKEELAALDKLEKEVNDVSIDIKKLSSVEQGDDFEYNYTNREGNLKKKLITLKNSRFLTIEEYRKLILNYLDEYGYLMERKKDASTMW